VATNVGAIEATVQADVQQFIKAMESVIGVLEGATDEMKDFAKNGAAPVEKALDDVEDSAKKTEKSFKDFGKTFEKVSKTMVVAGGAITGFFAFAAKEFADTRDAMNRLEAAGRTLGSSFDGIAERADPFINRLEELGAPGGNGDQLIDTLAALTTHLRDEKKAFDVLELSARLAARGMGDVDDVSKGIQLALEGNTSLLERMDPSLRAVANKWDLLKGSMSEASRTAGQATEILTILQERAKEVPSPEPWKQLQIGIDQARESIGAIATEAFLPFLQVAGRALKLIEALSKTAGGEFAIKMGVIVGLFTTFVGTMGLFTVKAVETIKNFSDMTKGAQGLGTAIGGVTSVVIKLLGAIAALEVGFQIANFVNKSEGIRNAVQTNFAFMMADFERLKIAFGKGNKEMLKAYEDLAQGVEEGGPLGKDAVEKISVLDGMALAFNKITEAIGGMNEEAAKTPDIGDIAGQLGTPQLPPAGAELQPAGMVEAGLQGRQLQEVAAGGVREPPAAQLTAIEAFTGAFQQATDAALQFGSAATETFSQVDTLATGLADTFATGLVEGFEGAGKSFAELFKGIMKGLIAMIARALILSAIFSAFGLGGGKGFGGLFKGFFGSADEPQNDALVRGEGSRVADLILGGINQRLGSTATDSQLAGSEVSSSGMSMQPVIQVHEATPMTWVEVWDRHLEKRSRERSDRQTVRT